MTSAEGEYQMLARSITEPKPKADESEYQKLARFLMETEPKSKEEYILEGIREALDEARNRMKYAAIEYAGLGAHEEAERAAEIRRSIMALSMERW